MAYAKIRPRRGTKYEWETTNPILEEGEFCVECPDTGIGTGLCRFKIGDGQSHWADLPYAFDGLAANAIFGGDVTNFNIIQLRAGTTEDWEGIDPILAENEIAVDITLLAFKIGDGTHKWTELKYMTSAPFLGTQYGWDGELDFGDESDINLGSAIDNSMLPDQLMDEGWNDHLNLPDPVGEAEEDVVDEVVPEEVVGPVEDIAEDVEDAHEEVEDSTSGIEEIIN